MTKIEKIRKDQAIKTLCHMIPLSYGWSFWQLNQSRIFTFIFTDNTYTFSKSNKKHLSTPNLILNNMLPCILSISLFWGLYFTSILISLVTGEWWQFFDNSLFVIQIPKENSNCNLYTKIIINYIYSSKKG